MKSKLTLEKAQEKFIKQYEHIWNNDLSGSCSVGIGLGFINKTPGIVVNVYLSQNIYDQLPDNFEGFLVHKRFSSKLPKARM